MQAAALTHWLTTADQQYLLQPHARIEGLETSDRSVTSIDLDQAERCQTLDGFGFSLTGGSALLISRLDDRQRTELLQELFSEHGIGVSFLRLTLGASDLSETSFSYDDLIGDETDFDLQGFNIRAGDREVLALLREILNINPQLRLIATPWSAPPWMKTNRRFVGGQLRPDCQQVYAAYLVRYLKTLRQLGIRVHALTPQNEPLNFKNDPSMEMSAYQQAVFIKHHLAPALSEAGLDEVEVFCWDHNCDVKQYPLSILADPEANQAISGSAWHLYAGEIEVLSEIHQQHPDKKIYFTEQWVGSDGAFAGDLMWHVKNVLIGSLRNWSQAVFEWNLAADAQCCPHTAGGESRCVGALTIEGQQVTRNVAYYIIAHAAKFLPPGSQRLATASLSDILHVAFVTPQGRYVVLALNDTPQPQTFDVCCHQRVYPVLLPAMSVTSLISEPLS